MPLSECYECPQLKLYLHGAESDLAGKCRSLHFSCSISVLLIYFWFTHITPLVLIRFFISWHHDSHGKECRALQLYWQQEWTENTQMPWEKSEITVMFIALAENKSLLKPNPPWGLSVMTLQLGKETKLFGTVTFVGLHWDHGIECT